MDFQQLYFVSKKLVLFFQGEPQIPEATQHPTLINSLFDPKLKRLKITSQDTDSISSPNSREVVNIHLGQKTKHYERRDADRVK